MVAKKMLAKNRKAFADYEIIDQYEAGIVLSGSEVKACRQGNANLKGSYVSTLGTDMLTKEMHISKYKFSQEKDYDPRRPRKLLLHATEIAKIHNAINEKGITVVPLELYLKGNLIKLQIGICRGKKKHDRREDLKRRDTDLQIKRALKRFA